MKIEKAIGVAEQYLDKQSDMAATREFWKSKEGREIQRFHQALRALVDSAKAVVTLPERLKV